MESEIEIDGHTFLRIYRSEEDKIGELIQTDDNVYQNGKIYAIVSEKNKEKMYIGSTYMIDLNDRLLSHLKYYEGWLKSVQKYISSFDIIRLGEYRIELLEEYPCNSKDELEKIEDEYIMQFWDICVNKNRARHPNRKIYTYKNDGKIYKLVSKKTDNIYIGSTIQPLKKRFQEHKKVYNDWLKGESYEKSAIELMKLPDVEIVLIENYSCNNKKELCQREQHYIYTLSNVINKINAVADPDAKKKYRLEHLEEEKARAKKFRTNPKNIPFIKARQKKFYEENIEEIRAKNREKTTCICGITYCSHHYLRHETSKKHISNMKYIDAGLPIPERDSNKLRTCECGLVHLKSHKTNHSKSKKHIDIMNKKKIEENKMNDTQVVNN